MLLNYQDRSAVIKAYGVGSVVYMQEVYAGEDAETLEDVCFAYQHDSDKGDVLCEGNTVTYKSNDPEDNLGFVHTSPKTNESSD